MINNKSHNLDSTFDLITHSRAFKILGAYISTGGR
jgi:hypothetical protein